MSNLVSRRNITKAALAASTGSALIGTTSSGYGAIKKKIDQKIDDIISVKDFGAIGDGIADDSLSFQLTINACEDKRKSIYIPSGFYLLLTPVDPKCSRILGDGMFNSILLTTAPKSNKSSIPKNAFLYSPPEVPVYREFLYISDIGFYGPGQTSFGMRADSSLDGFIRVNYYNNLIIENCSTKYSKGPSIRSGRCKNVIYKNNNISFSHRDGLMASGADYVEITGNTIQHCDDDGISAHTETFEFDNSGATAVNRVIIINNNRLISTKGIRALGAVNTQVNDNVILRPREHGIWVCGRVGNNIEGRNDSLCVSVRGNTITDVIRGDVVAAAGGGNSSADNFGIVIGSITASTGSTAQVPGAVPGGFDYSQNAFIRPENYWYRGNTQKDVARGGTWFIDVNNNQILRTLQNTALYSDYGYGKIWTGMGWVNPIMTEHMRTGKGISLYGKTGTFHDLSIDENTVYGWETAIDLGGANVVRRLSVRDNKCVRYRKSGLSFVGFGSIADGYRVPAGKISGNMFDGDPYLEHALRNSDGTWNISVRDYHYGVDNASVQGIEISGNTFRNLQAVSGNPEAVTNNLIWKDNVYICQPTGVNSTNKGIRNYVDPALSRFSVENSNPTSATYLAHIADQGLMTATAVPRTGFYHAHQIVRNSAMAELGTTGSKYVIFGWRRLTTGVLHTPEADHWQQLRMLTGG